jgi:ribosomal 50S subunit-associated protein YjgA (DUF615 family)
MKEYSNREIDMKVEMLKQHVIDSHNSIEEKLNKILEQTTQHNGRMRSIEKWRAWSIGYASAVTPIVAWMAYKFINHMGL